MVKSFEQPVEAKQVAVSFWFEPEAAHFTWEPPDWLNLPARSSDSFSQLMIASLKRSSSTSMQNNICLPMWTFALVLNVGASAGLAGATVSNDQIRPIDIGTVVSRFFWRNLDFVALMSGGCVGWSSYARS